MRRFLRILLRLICITSTLSLAATAYSWLRPVHFILLDRWDLSTERGYLTIINEPQRVRLQTQIITARRKRDDLLSERHWLTQGLLRPGSNTDRIPDIDAQLSKIEEQVWSVINDLNALSRQTSSLVSQQRLAMIAVVCVFLSMASFASLRFGRRKPRPGHCPHCNYDLRATPARCPECGMLQESVQI